VRRLKELIQLDPEMMEFMEMINVLPEELREAMVEVLGRAAVRWRTRMRG